MMRRRYSEPYNPPAIGTGRWRFPEPEPEPEPAVWDGLAWKSRRPPADATCPLDMPAPSNGRCDGPGPCRLCNARVSAGLDPYKYGPPEEV